MAKSLFKNDRFQIFNGDCLDVLQEIETASIDAILTDPPYCSGGYLEAQKGTAKAQGVADKTNWFASDNLSTMGLSFLLRRVFVEARRIFKPKRSGFVFCDWRMVPSLAPCIESSGLRYRNMIVWDKGRTGLGIGFRPRHEILLEFCNGSTDYNNKTGENVLAYSKVPAPKRLHPAEKPVDLLSKIIETAAPRDGIVVDPFMGSGSVLEACLDTGRKYIGIELDPKHCETAIKRLNQERLSIHAPSQAQASIDGCDDKQDES